ncbi:hypothetical protein [Micromonospora sp. NBRC 101691]|uniref:hypothetical protein n=1 Tax=Micromonospora sp. NBRC 101691 TaxID=3032198 RepID=UPI0024A05F6C|nr:hypothetical protein [Micromonospora sp. NBRC 101691]GLY21663.1 hypothetical protein Misp04_13950 [Micromonospora sp. NBRC 101691]
MTALDAPTQQQPAAPAPTEGPAPAGDHQPGRHRADPREPRHTRHLIPAERRVPDTWWPPRRPRPGDADTGWWTTRQQPAGPDEPTALLHTNDIQNARKDGTP